jgi:hypothetical protein
VGSEDLAHSPRSQGLDDSEVSESAADHTLTQTLIPAEDAAALG